MDQNDRSTLEICIWEAYKDAYGVRPRHIDFASMTMDELRTMADEMYRAADLAILDERRAEVRAVDEFEKTIVTLRKHGAKSKAQALRWLMDGSGAVGDWSYFCYHNGLPYGMADELREESQK